VLGGVVAAQRRSLFPRLSSHAPLLCQTHSSYCTKKLARLYRNLKLSHGRGRYQKRPLDEDTVTEEG
jgi:hypothetical protein